MLKVENKLYKDFKPYRAYNDTERKTSEKGMDLRAVGGAAAGVAAGLIISKGIYKHDFFSEMSDVVASNPRKKLIHTAKDVASMLTMAALSDTGATVISSIGKDDETKKAKIKEAKFQMMNTSIPMLMVTGVNILCDNVKALNNKAAKIITSITAMVTGAMIATKITNIGKTGEEEKRQYTIKDSVANFDDVAATIVVGFPKAGVLNQISKAALPFIYTYCGSRVSEK